MISTGSPNGVSSRIRASVNEAKQLADDTFRVIETTNLKVLENRTMLRRAKNEELRALAASALGLIRTPAVTMAASAVSARPVVREYLLMVQRRLGKEKHVVFEGRDMGTVVFPEADAKFFLSADLETRALRRYKEKAGGVAQTLEDVQRDMRLRDANDSSRELAPLKPAADAIHIDTTHKDIDAVVTVMLSHVYRVGGA